MGVKDDFMGASVLRKIAFIFLIWANFFNWLAFCTTEWGKRYATTTNTNQFNQLNQLSTTYTAYGLWRICNNAELAPGCANTDGWALSWYGAVQAFAIIGFLGINVALILWVLTLFVSKCKKNAEAGLATAIICFVAAACYLLAVIIFGASFNKNIFINISQVQGLGYSFGMAILSFLLAVVAGVLIIVEAKKGGGTSPVQNLVS